MEKVTMQNIADALSVSRVTVCKAFNNQSGVSEALKARIFQKAREMGYSKGFYKTTETVQETGKTVSLIVSRPETSTFWTNIIHRAAQELSVHHINMMYTYVPSVQTADFPLPSNLYNGTANGIIVLNVYDLEMLSRINSLTPPKVFLDTIPELNSHSLNGDLFLIEGRRSEYLITESLVQRGFRKIGFIGDIHYAQTNYDRYLGYADCMEKHGLPINPACCLTEPIDIFSYDSELGGFLSRLRDWPEAFVCVSDFVAKCVKQYLNDHRRGLPSDVVLTGFDNMKEYANLVDQITTANIPTSLLGKRLALQILYRMEHPDAPYELTYLAPTIVYHNEPVSEAES
ncbi:MAG: LacI family DNA-binding transcriptional regulator [Clostridium sp.]|nr:LacI family DNA-binding transcriptional regulator [Clostridium sp.]